MQVTSCNTEMSRDRMQNNSGCNRRVSKIGWRTFFFVESGVNIVGKI
jgi:hypothetical protein